MKTLFSLVILLNLISVNLFAQESNPFTSNKMSAIERIKTIETYNAQKRTVNIQQVLDSNFSESVNTTYSNTYKGAFYYDIYGRDTLDIYYTKIYSQTNWLKLDKYINTFNTKDQITKRIWYRYNHTINNWNIGHKVEFQYNSSGKLMLINYSNWDTISNAWAVYLNSYSFYNSNGDINEIRDSTWNNSTNSFMLNSTNVFTYFSNGNLKSVVSSGIDNFTLVFGPQSMTDYLYNAQNKEINQSILVWDANTTSWEKYIKIERTFYANQDLKQLINFVGKNNNWDTTYYFNFTYNSNANLATRTTITVSPNQPYPDFKTYFTYDANNYLINEVQLNYNSSTQQFEDSVFYFDYINDIYGNALHKKGFQFNKNTNSWVSYSHSYYTYNTNYLNIDLIYPFNFHINTENKYMPISEKQTYYDTSFALWSVIDSANYFFSAKYIDNIGTKSSSSINLYPNPANDLIYLDFPSSITNCQVEIYDITGKLILETVLPNSHQLSIKHLRSGVYILSIVTDSHTYSEKIIIE